MFRSTFISLTVTAALAAACTSPEPEPAGEAVAAGTGARDAGIDHYQVRFSPDGAPEVTIDAIDADGTSLGVVTWSVTAGTRVARVAAAGEVTDLIASEAALTIWRDGVVRYQLDRAVMDSAASFVDAEAAAPTIPDDLAHAVRLAALMATDGALIDYLAVPADKDVASLVPDCPWWVTLGSCLAAGTPVGAAMCAACLSSYLI